MVKSNKMLGGTKLLCKNKNEDTVKTNQLSVEIKKLKKENMELRETLEIMSDPSIMERFKKEAVGRQNKSLGDVTKRYSLS